MSALLLFSSIYSEKESIKTFFKNVFVFIFKAYLGNGFLSTPDIIEENMDFQGFPGGQGNYWLVFAFKEFYDIVSLIKRNNGVLLYVYVLKKEL